MVNFIFPINANNSSAAFCNYFGVVFWFCNCRANNLLLMLFKLLDTILISFGNKLKKSRKERVSSRGRYRGRTLRSPTGEQNMKLMPFREWKNLRKQSKTFYYCKIILEAFLEKFFKRMLNTLNASVKQTSV